MENVTTKKTGLVIIVFLAVNIVLSAAGVIFALSSNSGGTEDPETQMMAGIAYANYCKEIGDECLAMKDDTIVRGSYSTTIEGYLKNISKKNLDGACVYIRFILDGETIDYGTGFVDIIDVGESLPFTIYAPDDFDKYEIAYLYATYAE